MSKVLFYKKETDTKAKVVTIHNQPDILSDEQKERGFEIDDENMPEKPETDRNERALPYLNPKTGEVWYEVEERELSREERLEQRVEELEKKVSNSE